ncbi:radical SAM protein [Clostridium sp.]|uniref:radical SAM/SPASM domain-containing protein n=1 Tax=Clostridium sp. TaxID=1506 RepID=UPI0025BE3925|nr:radical SAM protein [Clostridium sp.]
MKISNYNFFIKNKNGNDEKIIAYNSFTNSIAVMDPDKYNDYLDFQNNNIEIKDEEFIQELYKGGFIIGDNVNEIDCLRYLMFKDRFERKSLNLTIAPTMDCNFRCIYCYEKNNLQNSYMSDETEKNIIKLIKDNFLNIENLNVAWYGGEPLLGIDRISSLSEAMIDICNKHKINYNASMVSNGYLLNRNNCEKLNKYKVTTIQITLDGDEETHDKRRFLAGGQKTYRKIIKNLIDCKDILPRVALRINTDNTNKELLTELIDDLKKNELLDVVNPYLGHVRNDDECYNEKLCLKDSEYAELEYDFQNNILEKGINENPLQFLPRRITSFCGADSISAHIIDSKGDLYRCWNDIGNTKKVVANINNDEITINSNLTDYLLYDVTNDEECNKCKVLPLCMGGCPGTDGKKNCAYVKYMLNKYIEDIYEQFKNKIS